MCLIVDFQFRIIICTVKELLLIWEGAFLLLMQSNECPNPIFEHTK